MAVEEDIEIDLGLERKKRMVVEEERKVLGLHPNEPIFWEKKSPCLSDSLWYSKPSTNEMKERVWKASQSSGLVKF